MNPELGQFRRPWAWRWLPGAGRSIRWLAVMAVIALAAPAEAQQGAGSTYGPVRRADTLWELALRFRGDADVNAQQVMIAILRANPEAFREGNINALRTGVTLRVPSAAEIAAVTRGEAAAEFARHEEAWRNRRRTGSAAPGPAPRTPARPAATTGGAPAGEGDGDAVAEELRQAQATVAELRERLTERDEAIEELLVQLAGLQRELREIQATATPPGGPAADEDEAAAEDAAAPRESWLPVSPLILGSSLIVLLVLIVVVTLLRQRGEGEEAPPEEPFDEEEGGDGHDGEDGGRAWEEEDGQDERLGAGVEPSEVERREPVPVRSGAVGAAVVAATATAAAPGSGFKPGFEPGFRSGFGADDETADLQEDETADLPIGMDLEGEEEWGPAPGKSSAGPPGLRDSEDPTGFGRHVEVGELDELELDSGPATGSLADLPADLGEQDGPPEGAGPGRPGRVRRG